MPQKIILVRHGETDYNKKRICQGWLNVPLNQTGRKQARRLTGILKDEPIDIIYTSDLKRAWQTAKPLSKSKGIQLIKSKLLRERNMGILQDKTWNTIKQKHPKILQKMDNKTSPDWRIPNGESYSDVQNRVKSFLTSVFNLHQNYSLAFVTHGGTKRAFLDALGFTDLANNTQINNTDITILEKIAPNKYQIRTTTISPRNLHVPLAKMLKIN